MEAPTSEAELEETDKYSRADTHDTGAQSLGNVWSLTKEVGVELRRLSSIHTPIHPTLSPAAVFVHAHTQTNHTIMELSPTPACCPLSRMSMWPRPGQAEQHISLASMTGLGIGT